MKLQTANPGIMPFFLFFLNCPLLSLEKWFVPSRTQLNSFSPPDVMVLGLMFWRISFHWTLAATWHSQKDMQKQETYARRKARSKWHAPTLERVCRNPTNLPSLPVPGRVRNVALPSTLLASTVSPGCRWILPSPRAMLPADPGKRQDAIPKLPF